MNKAVLIAAALVLAPVASSSQEVTDRKDREPPAVGKSSEQAVPSERADDLSQSAIRDRVAQAIETIADACVADLDDFCGKVTSGEGRVAMCMRAHEDQLSSGCRSTLYRVARRLRSNVDRVAEACWNEIKAQCGDESKIAQCLERKRGSLSPSCQTIVGALEQRLQAARRRWACPSIVPITIISGKLSRSFEGLMTKSSPSRSTSAVCLVLARRWLPSRPRSSSDCPGSRCCCPMQRCVPCRRQRSSRIAFYWQRPKERAQWDARAGAVPTAC